MLYGRRTSYYPRQADRVFIRGLEQALDDPLALHRTAAGLERLALNVADLTEGLLRTDAPVLAVQEIVHRTVRRSLGQWDQAIGCELVARYARTDRDSHLLASKLLPGLRHDPRLAAYLEAPIDWEQRLALSPGIPACDYLDTPEPSALDGRPNLPALYLGHPRAQVNTLNEPRVELESLRYHVERSLATVLNTVPAPMRLRLLQPCRPEQTGAPDSKELARLVDRSLQNSDAYLYAGVTGHPLGAGGMGEIKEFSAYSGPIAVAQPQDCPHSLMESYVLDDPMRVTIADLLDESHLGPFVATWLAENFEELLACHRRRHNRRVVLSEQHDAVRALYKRSSDSQIEQALAVSGMSVTRLERLLRYPEAIASVPSEQLTMFLERLEYSTAGRGRERGPSGPTSAAEAA